MATVAERKVFEKLFVILQNLYDLSKDLGNSNKLEKFKILYRSLETTKKDLNVVLEEIAEYSLEVNEDYKPDFKVLSTIDELCCHISRAAERYVKVKAAAREGAPATGPSVTAAGMGNFYSIFESLIHGNKDLSDADKVHYLVGRLKGPALAGCSGLAPTGENYEIIWKALLDKYHNKRVLANSYLEQIIDFKPLLYEASKGLNIFLEKFDAAVKALKNLKLVDLTDFILGYLALSKLDPATVKLFEISKRNAELPSYEDIITFVKDQSKILSLNKKLPLKSGNLGESVGKISKSFLVNEAPKEENAATTSHTGNSCIYCHKGWHYLTRCDKFKRLTPAMRYEAVRKNNWCYNCSHHGVRFCTSDRSCIECQKRHHILLHMGRPNRERLNEATGSSRGSADLDVQRPSVLAESSGLVTNLCSTEEATANPMPTKHTVLLSTAVVDILNCQVGGQTARFILDSGSQANLLTTRCCKNLGIKISKCYSSVQGLGKVSEPVLIVEKITDKLPRLQVDTDGCSHLRDIPLADDLFYQSREVDGILGAETFSCLIGSGRVLGTAGKPIALQTTLGYVVMGKVPVAPVQTDIQACFTVSNESSLEQLMKKFWEVEEVPQKAIPKPEEVECDKLYRCTKARDEEGRFKVALPFKTSPNNLGDSKSMAQCRLLSLERRLSKVPELRLEYNRVMQDYIDQGHMRLVQEINEGQSSYFIPHHAVFKPESISTPVRVVFDASAPSDSGVSLNDLLYSGPKLQADIFTMLINFRLFGIAITADIRQMYRQIKLIEDHWKFQRLLWRFEPQSEVNVYELTTVAFGVKSSPYLALRTVKQLILEEGFKYPLAARIINRDLYMDDLVTSVSEFEEAYSLHVESIKLCAAGRFELTKWSTNCTDLLEKIPIDKRLSNSVSFKADTKILGMQWNPDSDSLSFYITLPELKCTKRLILSTVARCYDPIGLIAPFILYLKLLVKELWRLNLAWDEEPPENIMQEWIKLHNEWSILEKFKVLRHVGAIKNTPVMLVAFADASFDGYGAVIYLRTITAQGNIQVRLVCAKSKVSPFKKITIPRLELCAATLLSKLLKHVIEVYGERIVISKTYAFSDSTTVLQWLKSTYITDIFVANRIEQIRENLPSIVWRHVSGTENPADCLSRGLSPLQLMEHRLWLSGPAWLQINESLWLVTSIDLGEEGLEGDQHIHTSLVNVREKEEHPLYELVLRRSSWSFILRTTRSLY
ncbi:uncharacterized protein LOC116163886 [Photinus pyralis]|uniref:uncharacterized protein LOC116163886 n=1 Tax=Photinus pyralis TaxID=7054 RepID=UPI0012670F89|nr:uncharacterized protein LOC116163886 [Photinus pyralis]